MTRPTEKESLRDELLARGFNETSFDDDFWENPFTTVPAVATRNLAASIFRNLANIWRYIVRTFRSRISKWYF